MLELSQTHQQKHASFASWSLVAYATVALSSIVELAAAVPVLAMRMWRLNSADVLPAWLSAVTHFLGLLNCKRCQLLGDAGDGCQHARKQGGEQRLNVL